MRLFKRRYCCKAALAESSVLKHTFYSLRTRRTSRIADEGLTAVPSWIIYTAYLILYYILYI